MSEMIGEVTKNSKEKILVSINEYKGFRYVDLRVHYEQGNTGEYKPTRKGISLMPNNVSEVIEGILKAMEQMGFSEKK